MADPILDLCNRSLQQAGARGTIASLTENSNEARVLSQFYSSAQQFVLTRARWNFAQVIAPAVAVAGTPLLPMQWKYAYTYPSDCIRVKSVEPVPSTGAAVPIFGAALSGIQMVPGINSPFALGNVGGVRALLSNLPSANINYTAQVADLTQWESQALIALELTLASKIAIPLSGDKTLARSLFEQAEAIMQMAMATDANEDSSTQDVPVDWLTVRDGGCFYPVTNN